MTSIVKQNKFRILFKTISLIVLACFFATVVIPSQALAQGVLGLPVPGTMVSLSPVFTPTILRGIRVYPNEPLKFDFIVDAGDEIIESEEAPTRLAGPQGSRSKFAQADLTKAEGFRKSGAHLKAESEKLIKYFLAALTIPEDNLWVNLSPHEQDRIIPDILGSTDMGTDMLAQDYILKQITASLMNPDEKIGRQFWDRVYKKVYEEYGTIRHLKDGETSSNSQGEFDRANIPVDTFNKVWIMPEKAEVYVQEDRAFVVESKLKVMLETDYVALQAKQQVFSEEYLVYGDNQQPNTISQIPNTQNDFSKEIIREIIIPALEKEVNTGKNFAKLRQIYNSLILAYWFKHNLKESIINKVYSDQSKIRGVDVKDVSQDIYNQYVDSFKKGVCDFIKVEYDQYAHKNIPRKYFSGGVSWVLDSTFNSVGKEIALEYIQENGLPKNDYKIEVVLNDVNTSLTEIPSFEEPNAISSSSSIEKMMMVDIMADLKEKAAKGALRLILFDLDNSFFWPNGYIGSEIQKEISIKILALNIFLSEILKIGKNSSKKIPNDDEIQELAEKSIKKAQRVVYTQGDKDEKNMADSGFFEMFDGLRREDLKELKGDATNSLKIRAFTARPKLKEKVTLHVLQSLGIINKKSKRQPGDHDKDKFIIDQVIFTSGEGKIKAEALKATIEPLQAKAAEEGNPIDATEIVFIDDKPVNTEAVANMNLGIRIIQVITRENVNHEKTSYLDFINFAEKVIEGTNEKKDGQAFWYLVNAYYAAKTSKEKREVEKKALVLLSNEKFREFQLEIANDDLRRIRKPKPITKIDIPKALQQKGYTLEKLERLINEKLDKSITFGEEIKPTGSSSLNEKSEAADDSAFNAETASSDIEEKQGDLSMGAEMSWEEIKGEYEKAILAQYEKKIKMYSKINSRDDLAFVKLPTVPSFSEKDELKKVLYSLLSYVAGEDIEGENFNPSEETKKALVQLIPHLVRIYQSATFAIPKSLEALQSLLALGSKNDMITTKNDFVAATAGCAKFAQGAGYVVDESLEAFESLFALGITSGMITTKDDFFAVLEECANSANNGIPKSYKALELFLTIGMVKGMITTKDDFAVVVAECVRLAHNVGGFFSLRALKTLQFLIAQGIEKGKVTKDNFVATISNLTPELTKLNQGAGSYVYISFDVLQSLFEENLSFNDYLNQLRKLGDNIESHYADYTKVLQEANLKLFMTLGEHKELGLTFFEESAINLEYINELRESSESFDLKKYQDKFKRYALKKEFFKNFATSGGKIHLDINPDDDKGQALRNLAPSIALRFQNHSWQNEKKCLELHLNPSISSLFGDLMTKNLIRLGLIKPLGLTAKDSKGNLKNIVLQESLQVDGLFTDNNTDDFKQEPKLLALALLEISTHFPSYTDYVPSDVATFGHLVPGGGKLYNENDSQKDDRIDLFQVAQISDEDINNPYGHLDSSRIKTAYAILGNGLLSQYKPESRKASLDKKLSPIIKEFITQIEQILTKAECYEAFSIKWTVDKWPQLKKLYEQIQSFRKTKEGKQYALEIRQAVFDAQAEILMAMFEDSLNRDVITEKNASVALDIFNEVLEDVLGGYQAIVGPEFFIQRIHELRVKAKEFSGTTAYKKASQQILKALDLENITAENQYSSAWGYAEAQLDQFFSTTKDSVDAFKQYLLGVQPEGNRAYKDTIKQEIVEHVENWMERDEPLGALEFLMLDLKDILEILVRFHSLSNIDAQSWYKEILEQLKMDVPEIKDLINESENLVFTREKTIEDIREVLKAYKVLEGKREEIIEAWEDLRLPSDILLAHVIGKLFEQDGRFIKKDLPKDPAGGDGVSLDGFGKGALKHQLKKGFLPTDGGSDGYWLEEGGASDVVQNDSKGPVVTPGEQEFLIETPIETAEHSDPAQTASSDIGDLKVFIYNKKTGKEIRMQDAEKFDQIEFFVVDDNDDPVGTVLLETDNFINHAGLSRKSLKKRINRGIIEESDTNNYLNIRNIEIDSQEYSYQVLRKMMESISDFMEKIGEERIVINKVFVSDQKVSKDLARYLNLNVNLSYSKDPRVNNRLEITFYPNKYKDGLYFQDFSNSLVKSHFSSKMKHLHSKRNSDFNFDQRRLNFGFWDHVLNDKTDFLLFVESGDLVGYAGYQKPFLKKVKQNNGFNLESFVLDKKYENDDNVFVMLDKIINQVKLQKIERLYFSFNDFYISPDTQAAVDVPNYSSQMLEVLNRYCNKRGYHLSDPDPYKMYYIDFSSLPDTPISQAKTVVSSNLDGIDPTTTASSDIRVKSIDWPMFKQRILLKEFDLFLKNCSLENMQEPNVFMVAHRDDIKANVAENKRSFISLVDLFDKFPIKMSGKSNQGFLTSVANELFKNGVDAVVSRYDKSWLKKRNLTITQEPPQESVKLFIDIEYDNKNTPENLAIRVLDYGLGKHAADTEHKKTDPEDPSNREKNNPLYNGGQGQGLMNVGDELASVNGVEYYKRMAGENDRLLEEGTEFVVKIPIEKLELKSNYDYFQNFKISSFVDAQFIEYYAAHKISNIWQEDFPGGLKSYKSKIQEILASEKENLRIFVASWTPDVRTKGLAGFAMLDIEKQRIVGSEKYCSLEGLGLAERFRDNKKRAILLDYALAQAESIGFAGVYCAQALTKDKEGFVTFLQSDPFIRFEEFEDGSFVITSTAVAPSDVEAEREYRQHYSIIAQWAQFILENYQEKFGGNKLIFIGASSKRAWQASVELSDLYDVNKNNIIYLELPRNVLRKTSDEAIFTYLKQNGVFDNDGPIAIFDNAVDTGGTLTRLNEMIQGRFPRKKIINDIMWSSNFHSFADEKQDIAEEINQSAVFAEDNDWMAKDHRRQVLIEYGEVGQKITPVFLTFKRLALFLSSVKEDENIFDLKIGALSKDNGEALPLVQKLLRANGISPHYRYDSTKVWKILEGFIQANSEDIADRQDILFRELIKEQRSVISSSIKGGIDFNAENMNVTTKGDEIDFDIPLDLQNITSSSIEGFVPIIINITPVTDFMGLLGLREDDLKENDEKEKHLSYVDDSFVEPMLCCQSMQVYDKKKS